MKDNLIPFNELTEEEQRKMASNGGKASVEVRRKKRLIKEQLELLLKLPLKDKSAIDKLKALGIEPEEIDNQMAMVISIWNKALRGDIQAFNSIRDTIGEKPIEVQQIVDDREKEYAKLTDEELRQLIKK